EMQLAAGASARQIDASIERIGLTYGIATRLTSWLAVDHTPSVDPRDPSRRETMPQALPYGTSIEGLGLREAAMPTLQMPMTMDSLAAPRRMVMPAPSAPTASRSRSYAGPGSGGAPPPPRAMGRAAPPPPPAEEEADADERDEEKTMVSSLVDRIRDAFTPSGAPSKKMKRALLQGKIVLRKGRELVIEIVLTGAMDWHPEQLATVLLASGLAVDGTLDLTRTTAPGHFEAGITLRIALLLPNDPSGDFPTEVTVTLPSGDVAILLVGKA
ncbi:MAG: hypothetical protein ABIP89_13375, partial [Polyangiaceae bacterium]